MILLFATKGGRFDEKIMETKTMQIRFILYQKKFIYATTVSCGFGIVIKAKYFLFAQ